MTTRPRRSGLNTVRSVDVYDITGRPIPFAFFAMRPYGCDPVVLTAQECFDYLEDLRIKGGETDSGEPLMVVINRIELTWAQYYELPEFEGF